MKVMVIPFVIGALGTVTNPLIGTGTGGLGNMRMNGDHPNYCIFKISQNTEQSTGDLRELAITQTPVKNYLLMLL